MKKTLNSLLDNCQPQELDSVLQNIDADLPDEAGAEKIRTLAMQKAGVSPRRPTARKIILLAACIALVAAVLVGCYVAEKVEYDNAVKFFDLNDLDTEGLTRSDIKRVYRDITTDAFQYNDSYELLAQKSDTQQVEGVDIDITNNANELNNIDVLNSGAADDRNHGAIPDKTEYFIGDEFEKFASGETVWRTKLPHCYEDYYLAGGKALIWGSYIDDEKHDYMHTSVALIDDKDGAILWEKTLDSKYHFDEYPQAVLTDDGRIAVLTVATDDRFSNKNYLVFRELNSKGEVVIEHEQRKDDICYTDLLTPLSDGWLAEYSPASTDFSTDFTESGDPILSLPRFIKFNEKGEIQCEWDWTEAFSEGFHYETVCVTEHQGKIFVSAQARPNTSLLYDNADDENIPEDTDSLADGFTDEWRDAAREEFSAVLFVFDPQNSKPEQFYSVGGAMALSDGLRTDGDGNLVWRVGRIVKCGWAPWASSFQLYGVTRRYDYTFDSDKTLLRQERTDCFDSFRTM